MNLNVNINRVWLYSGIFHGWWCYNEKHNIKINRMFKDYCQRNGINFTDIICKKIKSKKIMPKHELKEDFDLINFEDEEEDPVHEHSIVVDYIIRVGDDTFRIDLDKMKQINVIDPKKQRSIKYIDLPEESLGNANEIIKHLKDNGVKGIAGKVW